MGAIHPTLVVCLCEQLSSSNVGMIAMQMKDVKVLNLFYFENWLFVAVWIGNID